MAFPGISDIARLLPDAVVVIDLSGRLKWANAAAERLFGLRAEDMIGESTLDFVHPEDAEFVTSSIVSVQSKEVGTPIEIRLRSVEGWKLVEVKGTSLLSHPEIAGLVLSLRDLTERRRWEVARDEVSRFRALVHNAATIVMLLDATGRVESVSAAVTRLLGHDQENVEDHLLSEFVAETDRHEFESVLAEVSRTGDDVPRRLTAEVELLRNDFVETIPFELHFVNLLDDPTVRGLVVSAHDVSELRRSLEQLAEAQAELMRGARLAAIGELASVISHELRNPLGAATNFVYLARQCLASGRHSELEDHLTMVERQILRAAMLSEDLTSYVREHVPEPQLVELQTVVDEVLHATSPHEKVEVRVAVGGMTLEADPAQLTQMLTNLVTNAYQAMPDGGVLEICASDSEDSEAVLITVHDSGAGIDPEVAGKLFDPFFTTKPAGTGLGLAIVQRLAEAHRGTVGIENAPSGGAVATLELPKRMA